MTMERDKTKMPAGTLVQVRLDNGNVIITNTRSEPWKVGHGAWVVAIEGRAGGYSLNRVTPI